MRSRRPPWWEVPAAVGRGPGWPGQGLSPGDNKSRRTRRCGLGSRCPCKGRSAAASGALGGGARESRGPGRPCHGPSMHSACRLTLCPPGPVDGGLCTEALHRSPNLGGVHCTAPEHGQQLLAAVGVLAGAARPLGLQRRLWWARGRGAASCPGPAPSSCQQPREGEDRAFCSLKPELPPSLGTWGLGAKARTQDPLSPGRVGGCSPTCSAAAAGSPGLEPPSGGGSRPRAPRGGNTRNPGEAGG